MDKGENKSLSSVSKIYSSNGEDKESWSDLLCNIISSDNKSIQETTSFLKQNLINKEKVDLTLDIIDFLINYGSQEIIEQIAQKEFLNCVLVLLKNKSKSSVEVQKKIIFLTQKWHQKFEKEENPNIKGFAENYNSLKNGGIIFPPPSFKIQTYNNYISEEESQNFLMKANAIKKLEKESEEIKKSMNQANPFSERENSVNISNKNNNNVCIDDEDEDENENNIPNNYNNNISNNMNKNINNNMNNNIDNNNNIVNKNEDFDEENPYLQKNENQINNQFENNNVNIIKKNDYNNFNNKNHINNYNNNNGENNNFPKFSELKNQKSNYPNYPSQMKNYVNNDFNNNNQINNNHYMARNKTMNTNNIHLSNKYNNFNQNNNNNYNMNNNNNNIQNNNYQNHNNQNNNYNNPNRYNNNINNQETNNNTIEAKYYKRLLGNKLLQLNSWINEGKYSFNSGKLKEGIQEILAEIPNCNNMMKNYQSKGDRNAFEIIRNMRMDVEQTCARYEALMNDKPVEPFFSSFSGNTRQYYYNINNMFGIQENYDIGNFDNYYKSSGLAMSPDYGYQNNDAYKKKESFGDKLSDFGNTVKDGFISFGKSVKKTAVSGYEYVKKKIDGD